MRLKPDGRRMWRAGTAAAATVVAVGSAAVLAGAVPGLGGPGAVPNVAGAPDYVLYNGRISTVDEDNTEVQAIAVRDGDIIATGDDGPIRALAKQQTKVINLQGRRVLPGLIDGHLHGMRESYHCWTQGVRLDLVTSRAQALAMYAAKADELEDGRWIWTGSGGWSLSQLDDPTIFTFAELNAAAPKNPVWITGGGVPGPRVNQAALDALGLNANSPGVEVVNGQITGRLTGAASQAANAAIVAQIDQLGIDGEAKCLADFIKEANMRGLTAWKDAMGNQAPWSSTGSINQGLHVDESTQHLYRTDGLNARIAYNNMSDAYGANALEHSLAALENAIGFQGDDMLKYLGPGEDMMATQPGDIYPTYAKFSAGKRLSVETHVGGPIDNILSGMEQANEIYPVGKLKWKIAHPNNGEPTDAQLDRAKALGVGWSLTFSSVRTGGDGPRFRSVMNNSAHMCLATDAMNVAAWAPFQMIWMVVTGKTLLPPPNDTGVPPDQRLTRTEALRHYTTECAWFMDQEGRLGSLQPGYHADLIVLSDDYFNVPADQIKDLKSVLTMVDGRIVHDDGTLDVGENTSATEVLGDVNGTVVPTLSLSLGGPASFGAFTAGEGRDYTATTTANVVSTAGNAALTVHDPSSNATGRLVNGSFSLAQPLQAQAASSKGGVAAPMGAVGGSSSPTALLTYNGPVSNDVLTLAFKQTVGADEALRTGSYSKTLTFTLTTTAP
ncbi:MAG TPA: amidohydrolase family protein [Solirubrobacter sp.]|nr:amidohydrolase family protein [Solirubrobacter sp.]